MQRGQYRTRQSSGLKGSAVSIKNGMEIYIPMEGLLDVASEVSRLEKEIAKVESSLAFSQQEVAERRFHE